MRKIVEKLGVLVLFGSSLMALDVPKSHIVDDNWLKSNINDANLVIVDMRKEGYDKGHISGAVHWKKDDFREGRYYNKLSDRSSAIPGYMAAPLSIKRTMRKSGVNNDSAIVFYSDGTKAKDFRDSALAVMTSEYYGFDNVAILDGGFAGWEKASGSVDKNKSEVTKGNFSFEGRKFNQNVVATGEDIDEAVVTGAYQTVDTNGKQEKTKDLPKGSHWYGTAHDPRRLKEGHLPNAKAMHIRVLAKEKDGVYYLADKDQVLKEYEKAGIDPNKPVIWYCNTGHLVAGAWFVAQNIIGMKDADNRGYSGSMAEYTRWPKRRLIKGDE